jgi:hypothetical protein
MPPTHEWLQLRNQDAVELLNNRLAGLRVKHLSFAAVMAAATAACAMAAAVGLMVGSLFIFVSLCAVTLMTASFAKHNWSRDRIERANIARALEMLADPSSQAFENGAFLQVRGPEITAAIAEITEVRLMAGESSLLGKQRLPAATARLLPGK